MGMIKLASIPLNDNDVLRMVRKIAQKSENVFLVPHAKLRMRQRKISLMQVLLCLRQGCIWEPPHLDIRGDWRLTMHHLIAGDDVKVAVALKRDLNAQLIAVITVF
jgi:Domain of unknown function (DUF4258)